MTTRIWVLIANPEESAVVRDIEAGLEAMQAEVGGDIKLWAVDGHVHFLCNEEGRINGMPFNRFVTLSDAAARDICGPVLVVGGNEDRRID